MTTTASKIPIIRVIIGDKSSKSVLALAVISPTKPVGRVIIENSGISWSRKRLAPIPNHDIPP
jgi:hypothetical protein